MCAVNKKPGKVQLGRIFVTPRALKKVDPLDVLRAIKRHESGDWGNLKQHDRKANDMALECGRRVLSRYKSSNGTTFWIITEYDRSATTVMLPNDY